MHSAKNTITDAATATPYRPRTGSAAQSAFTAAPSPAVCWSSPGSTSPAPYSNPAVPTNTSRAGNDASAAVPIFQSHPSGRNAGSKNRPNRPSRLSRFHSPFSRSGSAAAASSFSRSAFSASVGSSFPFSSARRSAFASAASSAAAIRSS